MNGGLLKHCQKCLVFEMWIVAAPGVQTSHGGRNRWKIPIFGKSRDGREVKDSRCMHGGRRIRMKFKADVSPRAMGLGSGGGFVWWFVLSFVWLCVPKGSSKNGTTFSQQDWPTAQCRRRIWSH
jgi:hypothetical protein